MNNVPLLRPSLSGSKLTLRLRLSPGASVIGERQQTSRVFSNRYVAEIKYLMAQTQLRELSGYIIG
jgi:hypothetical protein